VAIVGADGAGTTTLLEALRGAQPASAGSVRFEGAGFGRDVKEAGRIVGQGLADERLRAPQVQHACLGK
jgi:ABC-type branched-subunit amino acid transport system ATPase component